MEIAGALDAYRERLWATETTTEQGAKKGPLIWWASSDRPYELLLVEVGVDETLCVVVGHIRTPAGLSLARLAAGGAGVGRP
jgi:hypothetical protein